MQYKNHSPQDSGQGFKLKTGGAAVLLAIGSLISAGVAQANSAAGEVLTNVVTVDYADAGGTAQTQVFASVTVTIDHLASATLAAVGDQTTGSSADLPGAYTSRLTNTGNGSDTYTVAVVTTSSSCVTGTLTGNAFSAATPAAPTLGATVTNAAALLGATSISVPYDGTVGGGTRGISDTDTITIDGNDYVVSGLVETAPAATTLPTPPALGTTTFTITPALVGDITAGTQVGEYTTITYGSTGSAGSTSSGAATCTHAHRLDANGSTETGGNAATDIDTTFTTTVTPSAVLVINKYVRNVGVPAKNTGGVDLTYPTGAGANEYRTSGKVSGNPGDILEYAVQIENTSAGLATNVIFQDTLPPFTSIDIDTVTGGTQAAVAIDQNTNETLDVAIDDTGVYTATSETETIGIVDQDIIAQSGQGLRIFPGTDTSVTDANETGADASAGTGGTGGGVPGSSTVTILYRVIIE